MIFHPAEILPLYTKLISSQNKFPKSKHKNIQAKMNFERIENFRFSVSTKLSKFNNHPNSNFKISFSVIIEIQAKYSSFGFFQPESKFVKIKDRDSKNYKQNLEKFGNFLTFQVENTLEGMWEK